MNTSIGRRVARQVWLIHASFYQDTFERTYFCSTENIEALIVRMHVYLGCMTQVNRVE